MSKTDNQKESKLASIYAKAILRGIILTLILILVVTAIVYFAQIDESYYRTITWIINILAICYAAIYGVFKIGKKGYLHGALIALIYSIIMFLAALLSDKGAVNIRTYIVIFIASVIIGALSGMIGMILKGND